MKIDVQGAEVDVLQESTELLKRCNQIVVETHHRYDPDKFTYSGVQKIMNNA